jgi:hypothetical protein
MHDAFEAYIRHGKALAETKALIWDFPVDSEGYSNSGWNLTLLSGGTPPPIHYLRDLGADNKTLEYLNTSCTEMGMVPRNKQPLDLDWQNLIKAATCEQLLFKRSSTMHVINGIIRPLKVLATCCLEENIKPWELNADVINKAVTITRENQKSGQLSDTILGVVKNIIDTNHLAIASPLYPALSVKRQNLSSRDRRSKLVKSSEEVLAGLEKRKTQEKLPERRAFWELIRIVFTECPQSYVDALRFAAIQVMVITGLRIGEAVRLPADWKRTREYYDISGKPAGELGGYSQALMLRHFAEKQQAGDGVAFYENAQFVPDIFEEILTETLNNAARITQPLRETLKLQCETRRLLPWYQLSDLVPVSELYTRLTGNPFWLQLSEAETNSYIERYRKAYDPQILEHLSDYQATAYQTGDMCRLDMAMYIFFHRLVHSSSKNKLLNFRTENGSIYPPGRFKWNEVYLNIQELESHLTENLPTKVSDLTPTKLADGTTLQPWEYLFLIPKRALAEERNAGITDITRYYSVGIPDQTLINLVLGEEKDNRISIFERYGETSEDKSLTLTSHSLRHLQNTELFRMGVADTIITKRFNRRSVAQSYVYDHRSLAETLDQIELTNELEAFLGEKATTVAKLIQTGKASGPIVASFKRIQQEQGDDAAFEFLRVEADGFHATPYGHCINSFTVDPCPKNLECFAGCRHLTATNLQENRKNLETLEKKFEGALSEIQSRPVGTVGRQNQMQHAIIRLESIRKLLNAKPGEQVFPEGRDFSRQDEHRSVIDG